MNNANRLLSGIFLIAGGIVILFLSTMVPWAYATEANCWEDPYYIYCSGSRANYDAPLDGLPFAFIVLFGIVVISITVISRTKLRPSPIRTISTCGLIWGGLPLFIPTILIAFSYSPGFGFLIYILSLIPIIGALVVIKGIKPSKSYSVPKRQRYSSRIPNPYSQKTYSFTEQTDYSIKPETKLCVGCGALIDSKATFCTNCGRRM
ncbi:MAG: hypothetical protein ACW98D_00865 [Promethearchaeota archaeon]|jgi:hypothetical protein